VGEGTEIRTSAEKFRAMLVRSLEGDAWKHCLTNEEISMFLPGMSCEGLAATRR
jgi:hypothetical protein